MLPEVVPVHSPLSQAQSLCRQSPARSPLLMQWVPGCPRKISPFLQAAEPRQQKYTSLVQFFCVTQKKLWCFFFWWINIKTFYLTGEHGTEVVAAGSQDDSMSWEICALHPQSDVAQCVALAKWVHCIEDGFGMWIGHDVLGSHAALRISQRPQTTQGILKKADNHCWKETQNSNRYLERVFV